MSVVRDDIRSKTRHDNTTIERRKTQNKSYTHILYVTEGEPSFGMNGPAHRIDTTASQ